MLMGVAAVGRLGRSYERCWSSLSAIAPQPRAWCKTTPPTVWSNSGSDAARLRCCAWWLTRARWLDGVVMAGRRGR